MGIRIFSLISPKIKKMYVGQQMTVDWLKGNIPEKIPGKKTIWMHCSSLGEFEQGRMILEGLREKLPELHIYLSFFSPSGYEIRKNWDVADTVFYLPPDTKHNAELLTVKLNPDCIILVKYDFWWNLLHKANDLNIPVYLVAANFSRNRYFFKSPFISIMKKWKCIFTIKTNTAEILKSHGFKNFVTVGDPRTDRVMAIKNQSMELSEELIQYLRSASEIIVYGSVWMNDMETISPFIRQNPGITHIVVPHDISTENIQKISKTLPAFNSFLSKGDFSSGILIVDKIGILSSLYRYARLVYVGGGFGKGIHNTLEAAVYEVPLFFGPKYTSFPEAVEFVENGMGFVVHNEEEFLQKVKEIMYNPDNYDIIGKKLKDYFLTHKGASKKIISHIIGENFTV